MEYLVGGALVGMSLHVARGGLLAAVGAAFLVLAATSRGRAGLFQVVPGRLHASVDLLLVAALAAGPILPPTRPDLTGTVTAEIVALLWLRVVTLTAYRPAPAPAPATEVTTSAPGGEPSDDRGGLLARRLGRVAGQAAGKAAGKLPEADRTVQLGARQLGRAAGTARRTWRDRQG